MKSICVVFTLATLAWTGFVGFQIAALDRVYWGRTLLAWLAGTAVCAAGSVLLGSLAGWQPRMTRSQRNVLALGVPVVFLLVGTGLIKRFFSLQFDGLEQTWRAWATFAGVIVLFEYWLFGVETASDSSRENGAYRRLDSDTHVAPRLAVWNVVLVAIGGLLLLAIAWNMLGIDWARVSDGDRLNALLALLLSAIGALIAVLSYRIASEQHAHFQQERDSRAVLIVIVRPEGSANGGAGQYRLYIRNEGEKAGAGFWYLGIPKRVRGRVVVTPAAGNEEAPFPGDNWEIHSEYDQPQVSHFTDDFYLLRYMMTRPVEPGVTMPCAAVSVEWHRHETEWLGERSIEYKNQGWRIFGWFTKGPSGRVPARGMLKLRMYSRGDSAFKNYHGGIELPDDDPEEFYG